MIIVPGFVVSALTFPGVIVHEAAHMLFCRWFRLAIFDVCFFQFQNTAGYVVHEAPKTFAATFFVSMGPFLVNTVLCMLFCSTAFLPVWKLGVRDPLPLVFLWLGLSIGMHAFPSNVDLQHVFQRARAEARSGNALAILSFPLIGPIWVLNFLRVLWVDLLYAGLVGLVLPLALFEWFV